MHPVLFCELQLTTVLLLTRDSYMSWSTSFISLKLCVGFPILDFVSILLIFFFNKKHGLFDIIIISFKIKIIEKPHSFPFRPLIFKLQQEVWKFSELELPENWLGDEHFKTRKSKFWVRHFFSKATFK